VIFTLDHEGDRLWEDIRRLDEPDCLQRKGIEDVLVALWLMAGEASLLVPLTTFERDWLIKRTDSRILRRLRVDDHDKRIIDVKWLKKL